MFKPKFNISGLELVAGYAAALGALVVIDSLALYVGGHGGFVGGISGTVARTLLLASGLAISMAIGVHLHVRRHSGVGRFGLGLATLAWWFATVGFSALASIFVPVGLLATAAVALSIWSSLAHEALKPHAPIVAAS